MEEVTRPVVVTKRESHHRDCISGWQPIADLGAVRRCPHGIVQRYESWMGSKHWSDMRRYDHPILWARARRSLRALGQW